MYIDLSKMNSGFCDRLRQVTFCIAYEQLKNNKFKLIEIYEKKNSECPFYISELINIKNYYIKNVKKKNKNVIKMDPFNSEITLKSCYKYNNRSTIDNYALLKKWKEIYRLIKPKKKIYNKLLKLKRFKKYLSLHIRLTDKLVSFKSHILEIPTKDVIYKKQFSEFYDKIESIIPSGYKYIYISSDENIFKNEIKKKLDGKYQFIDTNKKFNKKKLRQTSGEDFIFDLFAMSKSAMIISSTGGNVPYTSNLISNTKQQYIKWTSYKLKYKIFKIIRILIFFLRKKIKL
jgi:hypothetical protein